MNDICQEICYPDELADPFYEEDTGTAAESEEEIKQYFAKNCGCCNSMHYA